MSHSDNFGISNQYNFNAILTILAELTWTAVFITCPCLLPITSL